MTALTAIQFPLTLEGVKAGQAELDRIRSLLDEKKKPPVAYAKEPAKRLFDRARGERSREVLELLPRGKENALTPSQLGAKMSPWDDGSRVSKASARASIRNLQRIESHLLEEGLIKRRVVEIDFSRYDRDGAGRYFVSPDDRRILNRAAEKAQRQAGD